MLQVLLVVPVVHWYIVTNVYDYCDHIVVKLKPVCRALVVPNWIGIETGREAKRSTKRSFATACIASHESQRFLVTASQLFVEQLYMYNCVYVNCSIYC